MSSDDITMNAFAAFLALLGATLANVDQWPSENRTSDEILDFLQEVLQESTMKSDNLSDDERVMVQALALSLKNAVLAHKT